MTVRARTDFVLLLLAIAALFALALLFVLHGVLNADEGFYLAASHFVSRGLRPYQDFGYTQGPLWPCIQRPWLNLFGETLAGQRLTSLVWTAGTVGVGVVWLKRRFDWAVSTVFVGLLLGAPLWLAFSVKGKTYAFAALTIVIAAIVIQSRWRDSARWLVFIGAATLGIGTRLPTAGFFVPAGLGLLIVTRDWRVRVVATLVALIALAGAIVWAAGGDFDRLVFWTLGYHRASTFRISVVRHFIDCFRFAPVLWIFVWLAAWRLIRSAHETHQRHENQNTTAPGSLSTLNPQPSTERASRAAVSGKRSALSSGLLALISRLSAFKRSALSGQPSESARVIVLTSLLIGVVLNLSASTTYAEYVFPFFCALAMVVAPVAVDWLRLFNWQLKGVFVLLMAVAGWNYPPEFSWDLLTHAAQAEAFLRGAVPAGSTVAASMPEIPIAAGMKLPALMAMGKFGITEDFAEDVAQQRQMLTPESLARILKSPDTRAVVFSPSYNWNFFWTLPSYRPLSLSARSEIQALMRQHYELGFINAEYAIYVRK